MKISQIRIANFRSIKNMKIDVHNCTSILGPNGVGKSNVLRALNIFFGEVSASDIDERDWFNRDASHPIEIELTFDDLTTHEEKEFDHYFRDGKLVFMAEISAQRELKYVGWRMVLADFKEFFKQKDEGALKEELLEIYNNLRNTHQHLPKVTTKTAAIDAATAYEKAADSDDKELVKSSHNLYGGTGRGKLGNFVHWVYVPAVQDMSDEGMVRRGNNFARLIRRLSDNTELDAAISDINDDVNERVKDAISDHKDDVDLLSLQLTEEFQRWAHKDASIFISREASPSPVPPPVPVGEIKEGSFTGKVDSFGHGLHRAYLFSLLVMLAGKESNTEDDGATAPTIILGIEEPELYQHPHQSRHISNALRQLSSESNFQALMTTHSPHLIQSDIPESIIRLNKDDNGTTWCKPDLSGLEDWDASKVPHDIFRMLNEGIAEMFFSKFVVFVEGPEDVAYLQAYWRARGMSPLPHIIPVDGKPKMPKPIKLARAFNIDCFAVFDADRKKASHNSNSDMAKLLGIDSTENFASPIIGENFAVWPNKISKTIEAEMPDFDATAVRKKPLEIAAEVARVVEEGGASESLDEMWVKIESRI